MRALKAQLHILVCRCVDMEIGNRQIHIRVRSGICQLCISAVQGDTHTYTFFNIGINILLSVESENDVVLRVCCYGEQKNQY